MIKRYCEFVNEEIKIGKLEHDFHKHKFKAGDICRYISDDKELDGKLCKVLYGTRKIGKSFFQGISDFLHHDYCPEIPFAKSKTNTYSIEFVDVYDGVTHLIYDETGQLKKDSIKRTDTIKTMKGVPECMLEIDLDATKNYKEEQERERKKVQQYDPYGEEEWNDEDKTKHFKWDGEKWIKINELYKSPSLTIFDIKNMINYIEKYAKEKGYDVYRQPEMDVSRLLPDQKERRINEYDPYGEEKWIDEL